MCVSHATDAKCTGYSQKVEGQILANVPEMLPLRPHVPHCNLVENKSLKPSRSMKISGGESKLHAILTLTLAGGEWSAVCLSRFTAERKGH